MLQQQDDVGADGPPGFGQSPMMIKTSVALQRILPATLVFVAFLALWQIAVTTLSVREYLLPSPVSVLHAMGPGEIPWMKHIWITAVEIVGAFLIAALSGVLLGAAIAWAQPVSRALTPFLVFVNTLPKVAIAPLFLIWLGYGILPNMINGALIGFFQCIFYITYGLTELEHSQHILD